MAIPCHDANILLRDGRAPAGGSGRKVRIDFGIGVAQVRRYCARLGPRMLLRLRRTGSHWENVHTADRMPCPIREPSMRGS